MERRRLEALSGLRFVAAMHVVWLHYGADFSPGFDTLRQHGFIAVPLFFVLSGFILTYQYRDRLARGQTSTAQFLVARMARLYPLYAVAGLTSLTVVLYAGVSREKLMTAAIAHFAGVQSWAPPLIAAFNIPAWSLSVEFAFYLVFPFVVGRLFARTSDAALMARMVGIWIFGVVIVAAGLGDPPSEFVIYSPPFHFAELCLGIGAGHLYLRDLEQGRRRNGTAISLVALVAILGVIFGNSLLESGHAQLVVTHNAGLALLFALLVYGLAHGGALARLLGRPLLVRLGDASFALYILQAPLHDFVRAFVSHAWETRPLFLARYVAVAVPLSLVAHDFFERPMQKYLVGRFTARGRATADTAPASAPSHR